MTAPATDVLLADIGSALRVQLATCGFQVCKVMVTQDGAAREMECCDCASGGGLTIAVWENQSFPTTIPPILLPPDPHSAAYVICHELQFTVATCWPQLDEVPTEDDPREAVAMQMAQVRDCVWSWLDRCKRKIEQLTPDGLDVWNLGQRARTGMDVHIECTGWEWTIAVW